MAGQRLKTIMSNINARQFEDLCDRVWSDRASLLRGSGKLSGEAALVRAVFWRLCKAGIKTKGCADTAGTTPALLAYQLLVVQMLKASSRPAFDASVILDSLIARYQSEHAESKGQIEVNSDAAVSSAAANPGS